MEFSARSGRYSSSLLFGLGTGVLIASYTVWDAYSVTALMISPLILDYATIVTRSVCLAPIAWSRRALVRNHWRDHKLAVIFFAIFAPLAYILVLIALQFTPVVYVAPVREVSVLITVLVGSWLFREAELKKRLGWAAVILVGMVLLATA